MLESETRGEDRVAHRVQNSVIVTLSQDAMSGIRVSVSPSQAAYFAGEQFSFTITFHNTALPDGPVAPQRSTSFSPGHRAAHSISSAPLAKPPTSPGTPKTAYPSYGQSAGFPANGTGDTLRKGLVGQRHEGPRSAVEPAKQRAASKSLSVSISPQDLLNRLATDPKVVANGKALQCAWLLCALTD